MRHIVLLFFLSLPCFSLAQEGSGVVINEFMASSDSLSGIQDPGGSYADWIELYNNNSTLVNLSGFHLSDNYDAPDKFVFPAGATIEADGYVIIWADKDLMEAGLHADFKLNKAGEELVLSNADFEVLDNLEYGPQVTNVSSARIPNGTGDFEPRTPTFSANNNSSVSNIYEQVADQIRLSPNPATGPITVDWPESLPVPDSWQLADLQGRSYVLEVVPAQDQFIIQTPTGLSGMFLLWIKLDNQYFVKPLIIQTP
ncbi:MAG: lamin tail domain-containing protein [Bacteroidetes bacterium]|nr:lamin tail domain-containing protein [Bacteroidota bacterium]